MRQVLQLARREWARIICGTVYVKILLAVSLALTLIDPFQLSNTLPFTVRLTYWIIAGFGSYSIGFFAHFSLSSLCQSSRLSPRLTAILPLFLTAFCVTVFVIILNRLFFWTPIDFMTITLEGSLIFAISLVVSYIFATIHTSPQIVASDKQEEHLKSAELLNRLPVEKRGALIALSAEDHYVRIYTTSGETLLRLKLADAIALSAPVAGVKIHRSHWVAQDHIAQISAENRSKMLILTNAKSLPISRSGLASLKHLNIL